MWHALGAERVVLARECSLKEIKEIREHILEELELEVFVHGADAVYFGGEAFSLRAAAQNFSFEEIKEGAELAHSLGKKIYCTVK